jgi:kumamolisin
VAPAPLSPAGAATTVDWGDLSTDGLTLVGDSPDDQMLRLYLHPVSDTAGLEATALAVNDPAGARYGEQSTVARTGAATVPDARITSIVDTLDAAGAENVDPHESRAFVVAEMAIGEAESLFGVTWQRWTEDGADLDVPATTPVLPAGLDGEVDAVYGAWTVVAAPEPTSVLGGPVHAPSALPGASTPVAVTDGGTPTRTGTPDPSACAGAMDAGGFLPDQIADAYGLSELQEAGIDGSGIRIAVVDGSLYQASDLAAYRDCLAPTATPITDHVLGTPGIDLGTVEAALDLSVVSSMAPGVDRLDEFMVDHQHPFYAGMFLDLVAAPFDTSVTGGLDPHVVSLSYGLCESMYVDDDPMASPAFTMSEQVLATAAAARISYVVSTGDSGSTSCAHTGGSATDVVPGYPATSAWVTAVGGTNLTLAADNSIESTGVWNDDAYPAPFTKAGGGGTGGVSGMVSRPAWQDALVPAASGRAVPDVALYADSEPGWTIYADVPSVSTDFAGWSTVGGTSASTPLTASLAALVNQVNLERGQPTLGWMNPLLYSMAATDGGAGGPFLDVTLGTNAVFPGISQYPATVGYDFASGLGSLLAHRMADTLADPVAAPGTPGVMAESMGGGEVSLTATPALAGGTALSYAWDFDDDGVVDEVSSAPSVTHTYAAPGVQRATVVVRTSLGRAAVFGLQFSAGGRLAGVTPSFTG